MFSNLILFTESVSVSFVLVPGCSKASGTASGVTVGAASDMDVPSGVATGVASWAYVIEQICK